MKNFATIIFLLLAFQVAAQPYFSVPTPTTPAYQFQVSEKSGCAPFTVSPATNFGCGSAGNSCTLIKGDGSPPVQFTEGQSVQYSTAGNFTLEIVFGTIGISPLAIQVFANTQPTFETYACANNSVQIRVTDTNYDEYIIHYDNPPLEVRVPKGSLAKNTHLYGASASETI